MKSIFLKGLNKRFEKLTNINCPLFHIATKSRPRNKQKSKPWAMILASSQPISEEYLCGKGNQPITAEKAFSLFWGLYFYAIYFFVFLDLFPSKRTSEIIRYDCNWGGHKQTLHALSELFYFELFLIARSLSGNIKIKGQLRIETSCSTAGFLPSRPPCLKPQKRLN